MKNRNKVLGVLTCFFLLSVSIPAFSQIPAKVALSRAHSPVADGFTVAWTDLTNETAYHLEHATSANFTSSTLITNISANATSHALNGLTPNTTYYVRVRGAAAGGNGTWSDVQSNQLLSLDPGQTRYLSVAGVPHGASHSVNFTISDVFGSANAAGLASGPNATSSTLVMLMGANGTTEHTIFYNSSQSEWREGATDKGNEIVGFGKGFIVRNNTGSADIFLLSGSVPALEPEAVTVFATDAPAGRLSLITPSRTKTTSLRFLGLNYSDNTTTGLKRAMTAGDADLVLIPDGSGNLKRYHFDGTNWRSGLRTVADPTAVSIPAGGAFFVRRAEGSNFTQWKPPSELVTEGLVLHLDAANTDSYPGNGTTWNDMSWNGNHGTLTNGPTFSSGNGSIVFDGVDDNSTSLTSLTTNITEQITLGIWIKFNVSLASQIDHVSLISKENWSLQTGYRLSFRTDQGNNPLSWRISGGTRNIEWAPGTYFDDLQWHYIVASYDKTTMRLYVDNVLRTSTSYTSNITLNTSNVTLGGRLNGHIGQATIYNRALTAAEIEQNYNALRGRYGR